MIPFMEVNSLLTGKRGVSLPFTDYCEPMVSTNDQIEEIFSHIADYGKKNGWKYIEIRGGQKFFNSHEPSEFYFGHILDLTTGNKKISSNFRDSTKRNIKKALKEVKVEITYSLNALNEFTRLNALTRREHGLPSQPYHFFKKIYDEIILKHKGFISLATYNNTAVAGNMYFCHGKNVIFKYGASDKIYHHLRPNNLVMWEAIKWCCENGYKNLCFGKTEPNNDGLRQFKTGWGTEENIIKYYRYDLSKDTFVKSHPRVSAFQHKIFSKLPIPVLNALGTLLYKHMG
jgi:lipid II:glycine glycyltransferase (peptidoglycan interpeptide bridge formation enzyme)